jgi:hypothetical protein
MRTKRILGRIHFATDELPISFEASRRRDTHLQISQVEPLGDNMTAVSCFLSSTFSLKIARLTGGSDATRRFMLYLWWSER